MLDREIEYQSKLKQQKQELEKLLKEKQKLLEAQRQLSEIAKNTLASDGQEHQAQVQSRNNLKMSLLNQRVLNVFCCKVVI